jgi:hypothetical protein
LRIASGNCSQHRHNEASKRIMPHRYSEVPRLRYLAETSVRRNRSARLRNNPSAVKALSIKSVARGSKLSDFATVPESKASLPMKSKISSPRRLELTGLPRGHWPISPNRKTPWLKLLKTFDDAIASAFRSDGSHDAAFDH